jgi:hypothetical protein
MSNPSDFCERIARTLRPSERGVSGLVDDLLRFCKDRSLDLDWHEGRCRVCSTGASPDDTFEAELPKSVFRAALARLAALCDECRPGSVSPYGGDGGVAIGAEPAAVVSVTFTNTPDEQRVCLKPIEKKEVPGSARTGFLVRASAP